MKTRIVLCVMLGLYSVGAVTYAVSELYTVFGGCGAGCFGQELPFKNGTSGTRSVDVKYRESGPNGFSADPSKISGAISTAMGDWNNAGTTYQFQSAQSSNTPNVEIILVDDIKGAPRGTCMQLDSYRNPQTGEIAGARLYVKRSVFNNATQTELAQLFEHELGHFIGLRDFRGNADQCQTVMAQAQDGCHGLKGSKAISQQDVASVNDYVNRSPNCKQKRGKTTVTSGGGYVDPSPVPDYYPYTCYYYYSAYDIYYECDCRENGQYAFTVYVLDDVICF